MLYRTTKHIKKKNNITNIVNVLFIPVFMILVCWGVGFIVNILA